MLSIKVFELGPNRAGKFIIRKKHGSIKVHIITITIYITIKKVYIEVSH